MRARPSIPSNPSMPSTPPIVPEVGATSALLPASGPLAVRVLGTAMRVTGLPEPLRAALAELLQPFLVADDAAISPALTFTAAWDATDHLWKIYSDGAMLQGIPSDKALLLQLEWRIVDAALARVAGCGVFHAGALARDGAVVLLQGESGAGKTTLTQGLIARGWLPLSDDAAIVDARTLATQVFPRCFHVERGQRPVGARPRLAWMAAVAGHARPLHWAPSGQPVTAIVTVARDPEQPSSLTPMLRAEAAGALLHGAIRNPLNGSQLADLAARVAASARFCGRLNNSSLPDALDLIEAACAQ